jgi:hypothetical protein
VQNQRRVVGVLVIHKITACCLNSRRRRRREVSYLNVDLRTLTLAQWDGHCRMTSIRRTHRDLHAAFVSFDTTAVSLLPSPWSPLCQLRPLSLLLHNRICSLPERDSGDYLWVIVVCTYSTDAVLPSDSPVQQMASDTCEIDFQEFAAKVRPELPFYKRCFRLKY